YARGGDGERGTGDGSLGGTRPAVEAAPTAAAALSDRADAVSRTETSERASAEPEARAAARTGAGDRAAPLVGKTQAQARDSEGAVDRDQAAPVNAAAGLERAQEGARAPGAPPAPTVVTRAADEPQLRGRAVTAQEAPAAAAEELRREALVPRDLLSTTWRVIAREPARTLLGTAPVAVPGLPIRELRESPLGDGVVLVEQALDSSTVIQLFQQRTEGERVQAESRLARTSNERLARYVGGLRVEIAGPLDTDSLNKLLERVRPIPD
ncbi:MAG: hypothetical protein ACREMR_10645, partial [Gemmatimonadales bacterium]